MIARSIAAAILAAAAPAAAAQYSALYVFGDSLLDAGNVQVALAPLGIDPAPASAGYFEGRFSNGLNYADQLSRSLFGTPTVAALEGGTNYAFGGARATTNVDAIPDFGAQLGLFALGRGGAPADGNALYLIGFGGNDLFGIAQNSQPPSFEAIVAAITGGIQALNAAGARNFLVATAPDIGAPPISNGAEDAATALAAALNAELVPALRALELAPGSDLRLFDIFGVGRRIAADPAAFGLPAPQVTELSCLNGGASPVCTGYSFFDDVHPTAAVHEQLGRFAFQQVPAPAALALFGLGALALAGRRARR